MYVQMKMRGSDEIDFHLPSGRLFPPLSGNQKHISRFFTAACLSRNHENDKTNDRRLVSFDLSRSLGGPDYALGGLDLALGGL